jgi:hypothetical protein
MRDERLREERTRTRTNDSTRRMGEGLFEGLRGVVTGTWGKAKQADVEWGLGWTVLHWAGLG